MLKIKQLRNLEDISHFLRDKHFYIFQSEFWTSKYVQNRSVEHKRLYKYVISFHNEE